MTPIQIISDLQRHKDVFRALLLYCPQDFARWKPEPGKWCLLEVACHLLDEEREDFRARVRHTLEHPADPMPPIDPTGWVASRRYMEQDYEAAVKAFLAERESSVAWLHSLRDPQWQNVHDHPKLGPMSALQFLHNWLAHDHLHLRQILSLKQGYLAQGGQDLSYAGDW